MKWLVRITFLVMGGLLLTLTLLLMAWRATTDPDPALLMIASTGQNQQVVVIGGGMKNPIQRTLGPAFVSILPYPQQRGTAWVYVEGQAGDGTVAVLRVWRDGSRAEMLPDDVSEMVGPSPDGRYLYYLKNGDLYRARADGRAAQNLTAAFEPLPDGTRGAGLVTGPDNRWVAFAAIDLAGNAHLYRVDTLDGHVTDLTPGINGVVVLLGDAANGEWLAYNLGDAFYWTRSDGSGATQLVWGGGTLQEDYGVMWDAADLLLIQTLAAQNSNVLYAYAVGETRPRWTLVNLLAYQDFGRPVLNLLTIDDNRYRVLPDGLPEVYYPAVHEDGYVYYDDLAPDGRHYAYVYHPNLPESKAGGFRMTLYVKPLDDQTATLVHQTDDSELWPMGWLAEGRGLFFTEVRGLQERLWFYSPATGKKTLLLPNLTGLSLLSAADFPERRVGWELLILGGGLLAGAGITGKIRS